MEHSHSTRKLIEYIKRKLKKGYTIESLRLALLDQGYSRIAVEEAIEETNKLLAKEAPILRDKPVIKYEIIDEDNQPVEIKKPWWKRK